MKKFTKKGFSLIEILIVMVILAGLATMILPNLTAASEAQIKRAMENDIHAAIKAKQAQMTIKEIY